MLYLHKDILVNLVTIILVSMVSMNGRPFVIWVQNCKEEFSNKAWRITRDGKLESLSCFAHVPDRNCNLGLRIHAFKKVWVGACGNTQGVSKF